MSKRSDEKKPKPQAKHATPDASPLKKYAVRIGQAAGTLIAVGVAIAIFAPTGTYLVQTQAGRVIVDHPQIAVAQPSALTDPAIKDRTIAGSTGQASAPRTGAAVAISPSAIGAGLSNVRIVGFEHALVDEGKYSKIDHLEAYRTRDDVPPTAKSE